MTLNLRTPAPGIELYLGHNREVLAHLRAEGVAADLVLADPPYGIEYQGRGHRPIDEDNKPHTDRVPVMADLLKPDSAMLLFTREDVSGEWMEAMQDAGLARMPTIIWVKGSGGTGDSVADQALNYEMLLVGHKGVPPRRPWTGHERFFLNGRFDGETPVEVLDYATDSKVWVVSVPRDKRTRAGHPTPKPPLLMERALLNYTSPGDLVLDPYMGTGPVGVAALRLGRRYIGIEKERSYYNVALDNILDEARRLETVERARQVMASS